MDSPTFRAIAGPQFSDLIAFPPEAVAFWLGESITRLDPARWGDRLAEGTMLLTAHNLILNGAAGGGASGAAGPISSKSVGGVSVAFNTTIGAMEGAGAYNMTNYGIRFLQLARLVGMGGTQF